MDSKREVQGKYWKVFVMFGFKQRGIDLEKFATQANAALHYAPIEFVGINIVLY